MLCHSAHALGLPETPHTCWWGFLGHLKGVQRALEAEGFENHGYALFGGGQEPSLGVRGKSCRCHNALSKWPLPAPTGAIPGSDRNVQATRDVRIYPERYDSITSQDLAGFFWVLAPFKAGDHNLGKRRMLQILLTRSFMCAFKKEIN